MKEFVELFRRKGGYRIVCHARSDDDLFLLLWSIGQFRAGEIRVQFHDDTEEVILRCWRNLVETYRRNGLEPPRLPWLDPDPPLGEA